MQLADEIRQFFDVAYVQPARRAGKREVVVVALDLHNDMKLQNRMPAICSALDAAKTEAALGVKLLQRSGPKQSSTATWTFAVKP